MSGFRVRCIDNNCVRCNDSFWKAISIDLEIRWSRKSAFFNRRRRNFVIVVG